MAKRPHKTLITLTDEKGVDHDFEPLELFTVGKKNFALLQPTKSKKNEVAIFRFTMDKQGHPKTFAAPTEKEFEQALKTLEAEVDCSGSCCCDEACECEAPAKKKTAAKKAPAKKAAKKPARKAKK